MVKVDVREQVLRVEKKTVRKFRVRYVSLCSHQTWRTVDILSGNIVSTVRLI